MNARNETRTPTATPNGNQGGAGALAGCVKDSKPARWRDTTRKGVRVSVSPDGRIYYGTAQEVRNAALSPSRRNSLACGIRWKLYVAKRCDFTPRERREAIMEERRDAIKQCDSDARMVAWYVPMSERDYIMLNAGARLLGLSKEEYWAEVIESQKAALLNVAQRVTGKREIPMNRYERAALARLAQETASE